jgi:hypothetical protein
MRFRCPSVFFLIFLFCFLCFFSAITGWEFFPFVSQDMYARPLRQPIGTFEFRGVDSSGKENLLYLDRAVYTVRSHRILGRGRWAGQNGQFIEWSKKILSEVNLFRDKLGKERFREIRIYRLDFDKDKILLLSELSKEERKEQGKTFPQNFLLRENLIASSNW